MVSLVMTNLFCCYRCSSFLRGNSIQQNRLSHHGSKGFIWRQFFPCVQLFYKPLLAEHFYNVRPLPVEIFWEMNYVMLTRLWMMWTHCGWMWSCCIAVCPLHGSLPDQLASSVVGSYFCTLWFSRKKVLFFFIKWRFFYRIKIFFIEWKFNKPRFFFANYIFQRMKLYFVEEKCISSNKNILIKSCSISATLCIGQFFPSLSSLDILGLIEFFLTTLLRFK